MAMSDLYVHAADVEIEAIACLEAVASGLVPVIAGFAAFSYPAVCPRSQEFIRSGQRRRSGGAGLTGGMSMQQSRHQMARVYAESANQYRSENSIRKAEQMFAGRDCGDLGINGIEAKTGMILVKDRTGSKAAP